jgi:hypothetical protein
MVGSWGGWLMMIVDPFCAVFKPTQRRPFIFEKEPLEACLPNAGTLALGNAATLFTTSYS